jgi:hypothetical protein
MFVFRDTFSSRVRERGQNNGERATVDDLAVDVKQRAHPDIVETIPRHIAEIGISMLANFQRLVVE